MLSLRRALSADVPSLVKVANAAYGRYVARIGRPPAPMTADYDRLMEQAEIWVAEDETELVGMLVLIENPGHLLLDNVAIIPSAQGRGIGAGLLRQAEKRALELGLTEIRLYTNAAMTENLAYYVRHGYVETHRAEQDGFQRVFFSKRIGTRFPGHHP
jgi:ribosomal protein S18 acetylase RimI-like enzyme